MTSNPIKKLAGETAIYGLGTVVPRLLNYFLVPLYTYVFSQQEYGQVTELYAWVALIMVILTYGMETAFFRYAELEQNASKVFNTAMSAILITSSVFLFLVLIFLDPISASLQYGGNKEYVLILAFIVAFDAFAALPFAYLRYQNKARRFSFIKIVSVSINIVLNLVLILWIPIDALNLLDRLSFIDVPSLIIFVFIANLISSFATLVLLFPELRAFRFKIDTGLFKKLLAFGLPILVIGIAGMINEVSDKILLRYFLPENVNAEAQIGIYGANYKLAILMMLFIQMFRYAAEPFFFREAGRQSSKESYSLVMTYFVIFTLIIFLGVNLYIDVFKYFIGPSFWIGLQVVPIVLAAKMFLGIFYNLSVWYKLTNKTLYGALISLIGAAITIFLNVILIPIMGYMGAAWANFVCYFSMMTISYFWGRKVYRVKYNIIKIFWYSLLAGGLYALSVVFKGSFGSFYLIINSLFLVVFILVVFKNEMQLFIKK